MLSKKLISLVIVLGLIVTLFSACNSTEAKEETTKSLALCIQNTANTASPMINDSEVSNSVYETIRSNGKVTIIEVDGNAYTVDKIVANIPDNVSNAKKAAIAKQLTKQVVSIAGSAVPKTGEVDVLSGLINAARNIDSSCDEKTVLYLGSALQTTGYLPFASQNLFDTETSVIISQLKAKNAIPEFPEGTSVVFAGLGDTAAPQKDLTYAQVAKLKEIMTAICTEGGANVSFITATPVSNTGKTDYPAVSTVTIYEDYVEGVSFEGPMKIDSTQISFEPDSYTLSDKDAAKKFLSPYVDLINTSAETFYICGTTATVGNNDDCIAFSMKRAQAIVDLLKEMGVADSKLTAKGLGFENNFHIPDLDSNGNLLEEAAQKNRLVLIIPSSCSDASKI